MAIVTYRPKRSPRKKRRQTLITFVLAVTIPAAGWAADVQTFNTGSSLLDLCDHDRVACGAYATGVADAMALAGGSLHGMRACISLQISIGQMADVVLKSLRDHPERQHYAAASLVSAALMEAFPCQ